MLEYLMRFIVFLFCKFDLYFIICDHDIILLSRDNLFFDGNIYLIRILILSSSSALCVFFILIQKYTATQQGCISGKKKNPFFPLFLVYRDFSLSLLSIFLPPQYCFPEPLFFFVTFSLFCSLPLLLHLSYSQFLCPSQSNSLSRPCLWCQTTLWGRAYHSLRRGCCPGRPCGSAAESVSSSAAASAAPASAPRRTARRCGRWR